MTRISGKIRRVLVDAGLVSDQDWAAARDKGGNVIETLLSNETITGRESLTAMQKRLSVSATMVGNIGGAMTMFAAGRTYDNFVQGSDGHLRLAERICVLDSRQIDTLLVIPL